MLIQLLVASPSMATAFANSVSPTGVEQTVSRAPLPPVEAASRNSANQNQRRPFPTNEEPSSPSATPTETQARPPAQRQGAADSTNKTEASLRQQQQEADQALLAQLKARDREVRLHEAAHAAVGGRYAGAPSYDYRRGPDGQQYAVGGEVSISTSAIPDDPQATIEKARIIRAAALAPAEPSAQDRQVAADAAQLELNARAELREAEMAARSEEAARRADHQAGQAIETESETRPVEGVEETAPPAETATAAAGKTSSGTGAGEESTGNHETDAPNARERLEELLLSTGSIHQQANRLGLIKPQHPAGKSGFLDLLA